jgi:hypothetical protein
MEMKTAMKIFIVISLITAATLAQGAGQSTKTDPTTRTIREAGSNDLARQDTTADAAENSTAVANKEKSKPKQRQVKKKGTTTGTPGASTTSK